MPNPILAISRSLLHSEATGARALTSSSYTSGTAMTEESCIAFCGGKGAAYAGLEYASECYCGNTLDSTASAAPASDCNMACSGNSTEACGAGNRLTLFNNPNVKPAVNIDTHMSHRWSLSDWFRLLLFTTPALPAGRVSAATRTSIYFLLVQARFSFPLPSRAWVAVINMKLIVDTEFREIISSLRHGLMEFDACRQACFPWLHIS